jgi:hypothetical protein
MGTVAEKDQVEFFFEVTILAVYIWGPGNPTLQLETGTCRSHSSLGTALLEAIKGRRERGKKNISSISVVLSYSATVLTVVQ